MEKSPERQILEKRTNKLFSSAYRKSLLWLIICAPVLILGVDTFFKFFSKRIRKERVAWLESLKDIERLEIEEGFPAASAYIGQLKALCSSLPDSLSTAYYPFAGTDIYWGSVFSTLILEDKNFDTSKEHDYSMWWGRDEYSLKKCIEVEGALKREELIPDTTRITYLVGDSCKSRDDNDFNEINVVLISKSANKLPNLLQERFKGQEIKFGAIIIVNEPASQESLNSLLVPRGYECVFQLKGEDFLVPYAMSLGRSYLYLKCST